MGPFTKVSDFLQQGLPTCFNICDLYHERCAAISSELREPICMIIFKKFWKGSEVSRELKMVSLCYRDNYVIWSVLVSPLKKNMYFC